MTGSRYRVLLRTLYGAVVSSRLSSGDLKALVEELRRGRLPDELAFMIDRTLSHIGGVGADDSEDERLSHAERLIRRNKISKPAIINILLSLGMPSSDIKGSTREILIRFLEEAPSLSVSKFFDLIASPHDENDDFLAGISDNRK